MRKPNDAHGYLWIWVTLAVISLAAGAAWAGGVVYVHDDDDSDTAWLGVILSEETEDPEGGARVDRVMDGSPAEEAGIEKGDVIQGLDGQVVRGPRGLSRRIDDRAAGDLVSIRLIRDGREMTLDVELGERSGSVHSLSRSFAVPFDEEQWEEFGEKLEQMGEEYGEKYGEWAERLGDSARWENLEHLQVPRTFVLGGWSRPKLGVQLSETTPELREHFGGDEDSGVLISKVMPDMPAAEAGLEVGDLIVAVDGEPVASADAIIDELSDKEGETFVIDVIRDGKARAIEVTIPERNEPERQSGPRAWNVRPAPRAMPEIRIAPVRVVVPSFELPELPALPDLPDLGELRALPAPPAPPAVPVVNASDQV